VKAVITLISVVCLVLFAISLLQNENATPVELIEFAGQTSLEPDGTPEGTINSMVTEADKENKSSPFVTVEYSDIEQGEKETSSHPASLDMRESFDELASSPEDETVQELRTVNAMRVEVSDSPAPEVGYSSHNDNAELTIPSERRMESSNMDK
jgi:hypothetical protein